MKRLAFLLFACFALAACGKPSKGSAEEAFEAAIEAVEQSDPEALDALLASDFAGESDRATTMIYARQWFSRKPKPSIKITVLDQERDVRDKRVTFHSQVLVTSGGGIIPERSSRVMVDTQWEEVDGQWRLRVAQWSQLR